MTCSKLFIFNLCNIKKMATGSAVQFCPTIISSLPYDTACLQVRNDLEFPVNIYASSSECVECDGSFWTIVPLQSNVSLVASAVHSIQLTAKRENEDEALCESTVQLRQHELVSWNLRQCTLTTLEEGDDVYLPLYVLVSTVVGLLLLSWLCRVAWHSQRLWQLFIRDPVVIDMQNDLGNPSSSSDSLLIQSELVPLRRVSSSRIQALDTFRGLCIALMIFVNYGGGKYWFFEHSAWDGLTVADFVYPWFAWVMGLSLVLSYRSKLRSCVSRGTVLRVSLLRTVTLVTLGVLLNTYKNNDLDTVRFCGVLQRLGVAHLVVSTLEIAFMKKQPSFQRGPRRLASGLADSWRQWLVILSLTGLQVYVSMRLPVPACPLGYLGAGGASHHGTSPNCTGGAARYIDSLVFGDPHLYKNSPVHSVYRTIVPFDPEGLLGTLTTCLTVYLGVQAGYIILTYNTTRQRLLHWTFWALLTGVSAGLLCGWSLSDTGLIPINKQLWSLSFALSTAAAAFLVFTTLFVVVDHFNLWSGNPFRDAGMNAVLLYVGHIVTRDTFPWSWRPYHLTSHAEFLAMNTGAVLLWLLIARILHQHQIYLTL